MRCDAMSLPRPCASSFNLEHTVTCSLISSQPLLQSRPVTSHHFPRRPRLVVKCNVPYMHCINSIQCTSINGVTSAGSSPLLCWLESHNFSLVVSCFCFCSDLAIKYSSFLPHTVWTSAAILQYGPPSSSSSSFRVATIQYSKQCYLFGSLSASTSHAVWSTVIYITCTARSSSSCFDQTTQLFCLYNITSNHIFFRWRWWWWWWCWSCWRKNEWMNESESRRQ